VLNVSSPSEAINLTLEQWQRLMVGEDAGEQTMLALFPDSVVAKRHDGIQVIQEPQEPTPVPCDKASCRR
jgi:hypothetical protein